MKHKLTVLACIGLALLLMSGAAFAQNTVTVVGGTLNRCAPGQSVEVQVSNADALGLIGLPLTISGGATITGATAGPLITGAGWTTAESFTSNPGTAGVLNAYGGSLAGGVGQLIWTLQVSTGAGCGGGGPIVIDTAFYPPAGAFLLGDDVSGCAVALQGFNAGSFTVVNAPPICGVNSDESVHFRGSISKPLNASDPDVCDNPLASWTLDNSGGLNATAAIHPTTGVFTYTASCADKGVHTVTFHATDACGASTPPCTFQVTVTNDAPTCGANSNENVYFGTGVPLKTLNAGPNPNNDPLVYSLVSVAPPPSVAGSATVTTNAGGPPFTGKFSWATSCADVGVHTVTFRISDGCDSVDCSFTVTVFQNPPVATCPPAASVDWAAANQTYPLSGTDDNCPGPYTWSVVSVVPPSQNAPVITQGGLNGSTITFDPDCLDVPKGPITITVRLSDGALTADCSFDVTVTNEAPVIDCPDDQFGVLGDTIRATITSSDEPNNGPLYYLVSFIGQEGQVAPHNQPTVNASSGEFEWATEDSDADDAGLWTACVRVADGCGLEDTCCFNIDILAFALCVRSELDSVNTWVLNGQIATVCVTLSNTYELGGIDLLLCYDVSGLSFLDAFCEDELCDWEYFTWRHGPNGNCQGGACPTGFIRIVAIADLDNGPSVHPPASSFFLDGCIVKLRFAVTSDRNFINQCLNVDFCVLDCGDNALSSRSGDSVFFPIGTSFDCIDTAKQEVFPIIEFCPGRICIMQPPDDRGDINLNGLANEIGDAVLFTNYFVYGSSVWDPVWFEIQILATDINNDGIVLTVADLIYLIRIITGDEQPFPDGSENPKISPYANSGTATVRVEDNSVSVSTSSSVDLGGALLVFRYNGLSTGEPTLLSGAAGMNMRYNANGNELRVLVHPSWDGELATIGAGNQEILSIPTSGDGSIELVEVQLSDARGALLSSTAAKSVVPTEYALQQNYPNPFNAGTVMSFDLVKDADWTLTVFNVAGQTVREFSGRNGVGSVRVAWDGTTEAGISASSGVYFYRVTANGFNATKKMTLMK